MMSELVVREVARESRNGGEISWGDEVATSKTATRNLWTSRGVELHKGGGAPTMGGFLVNFLCKENWNIGAAEAQSKGGWLRFRLTFV